VFFNRGSVSGCQGFRRNRPKLPATKFATTVLCGCSNAPVSQYPYHYESHWKLCYQMLWLIAPFVSRNPMPQGSMSNANICWRFCCSKKIEKTLKFLDSGVVLPGLRSDTSSSEWWVVAYKYKRKRPAELRYLWNCYHTPGSRFMHAFCVRACDKQCCLFSPLSLLERRCYMERFIYVTLLVYVL